MAAPVPADGIGNGNGQYRFVIGVDFGTTYTGKWKSRLNDKI